MSSSQALQDYMLQSWTIASTAYRRRVSPSSLSSMRAGRWQGPPLKKSRSEVVQLWLFSSRVTSSNFAPTTTAFTGVTRSLSEVAVATNQHCPIRFQTLESPPAFDNLKASSFPEIDIGSRSIRRGAINVDLLAIARGLPFPQFAGRALSDGFEVDNNWLTSWSLVVTIHRWASGERTMDERGLYGSIRINSTDRPQLQAGTSPLYLPSSQGYLLRDQRQGFSSGHHFAQRSKPIIPSCASVQNRLENKSSLRS
ncbi:hypothetical protein BV22DRAFT_1047665 [Leucogyrophana mollusca]|uniref:Uncharacterized protein n=1 Tax=Leucogyrophana mollusca TaxID=85980 RepID=A0ACB8BG14_9AGAM|nr:hypothetical protein BV22DRAFT_1047665 [Leucogyrophana mollusca]